MFNQVGLVHVKVKIFSYAYEGDRTMENDMNELLSNKKIRVIDIKFSETLAYNANTREMDGGHSALVLYEEKKVKR